MDVMNEPQAAVVFGWESVCKPTATSTHAFFKRIPYSYSRQGGESNSKGEAGLGEVCVRRDSIILASELILCFFLI